MNRTKGILLALAITIALAGTIVSAEARMAPQGVQYDRQAIVNEAYYAVTGSQYYCPYVGSGYNDNLIGYYNYLLSDVGAYWHTREGQWRIRYPDWAVSSNNDNNLRQMLLSGNLPSYGLAEGMGRGGQCKYFANLVLYRAEVEGADPMTTYTGLQSQSRSSAYAKPGDVLFKQNYHTAIVVRVLEGDPNAGTVTAVQVVDSNWVIREDDEIIGIHNYYGSQLAEYRVWTGVPYYNY